MVKLTLTFKIRHLFNEEIRFDENDVNVLRLTE